eukprot:245260_1
MAHSPDNSALKLELKRVEKSYVQLLDHTSMEIERLKLVIHCLLCIDQNKQIPATISTKMLTTANQTHRNPISDITLFDEIQDQSNYESQIEQLCESKIILIRSSSFEIDRLRTIIKYLVHKMKPLHSNKVYIAPIITNAKSPSNVPSLQATPSVARAVYGWDEISEHNA